ncbi:MAG: helix-turn-helix domain-containing protein [Candidatus Bipolaricaulota bacterium]|nr:helix-turn-helix domain-containing protein [Candidatus Bipolaricaulota bacterium]
MTQKRLAFGRKIRRAREEKGIGLRELARRIDIDYSHLSRIERGKRPPPDLEVVVKIARELKMDRAKLLSLAGVPEEVITENSDRGTRNWISGSVVGKEGDLTKINAGDWILHTVEDPEADEVLLGLRPEDITLYLPDEGFSAGSARNTIKGAVSDIEDFENYNLVKVDCGSFNLKVAITDTSLQKMNLSSGKEVFATFKATAPIIRT